MIKINIQVYVKNSKINTRNTNSAYHNTWLETKTLTPQFNFSLQQYTINISKIL